MKIQKGVDRLITHRLWDVNHTGENMRNWKKYLPFLRKLIDMLEGKKTHNPRHPGRGRRKF